MLLKVWLLKDPVVSRAPWEPVEVETREGEMYRGSCAHLPEEPSRPTSQAVLAPLPPTPRMLQNCIRETKSYLALPDALPQNPPTY